MKLNQRECLSGLLACGFAATAAAAPAGVLPPGNYQIDSDGTMTIGSGPTSVEQRTYTDGATGTVTSKTTAPDGSVTTQVVKGDKPVTRCVGTPTAAEVQRFAPFACQDRGFRNSPTVSSLSAACHSLDVKAGFRMIDSRTWENTMTLQVHADPTPMQSVRQAMAMAAPAMTPAQRHEAQQALSEMPSDAEMARMNAGLLREMEESVRTAETPEDAAFARQNVQDLQRRMSGTAVLQTFRIKERWTLLSSTCR